MVEITQEFAGVSYQERYVLFYLKWKGVAPAMIIEDILPEECGGPEIVYDALAKLESKGLVWSGTAVNGNCSFPIYRLSPEGALAVDKIWEEESKQKSPTCSRILAGELLHRAPKLRDELKFTVDSLSDFMRMHSDEFLRAIDPYQNPAHTQ